MKTNSCASYHSTGSSGTHRTPWWARRAWTDCKIILQNIHNSFNYHMIIDLRHLKSICHLWDLKCFWFLFQGPRWCSWPPWTRWQSWRWRMYTFVFLQALFKGYVLFSSSVKTELFPCGLVMDFSCCCRVSLQLKCQTLTSVLLTHRVTTADLASPETEVPPAHRWEIFSKTRRMKHKQIQTDVWTVNMEYVLVIFPSFWIAGCSWIPRNPRTSRNEGTQSECWIPLAWSKQPKPLQNIK